MIYCAWVVRDDDDPPNFEGIAFGSNQDPPRCLDGTLVFDHAELLYCIEAESYNEAMAEHHRRQGWEPYQPMD
jgi:hypothetical protein